MRPPKKFPPGASLPVRQSGVQNRQSQTKPGGAPLKSGPLQPKAKQTTPPVYCPQPLPKVLQTKRAAAQPGGAPVAPPAYRPQPSPKVLQTKKAGGRSPVAETPRRPVAPPVYRPEPRRVVQPKVAVTAQARKPPKAPPVYRPEPKILQPKAAPHAQALSKSGNPKAIQPKPFSPGGGRYSPPDAGRKGVPPAAREALPQSGPPRAPRTRSPLPAASPAARGRVQESLARGAKRPGGVLQRLISKNATQAMQEANIDPNDISAVTGFLQNYYKNTLLPQITLNNNSSPKKSAWSDKVLSLLQQSFQAVNDKKGADAVNTIDQAVVAVNKWEKMEPPSFESEQPLVIGSGTVTSMTGVEDYLGVQHSFAHRYEGSEAPNSHWVQFVWITVERKEPSSPPELLSGSTSGNIGEVPFTTDVNQKKICIDALNKNTEPYYEQFGTHIKTATLLEMQDKPTALSTFKDDDAYQCMVGKPIGTKITQALHFDSFLVQNAQTVAHAEVTVTNQWEHVQCGPVMTTKQQNIKDQKQIGNVQAVNAMPAEYKSVMLTRFSGFSNIN